MKTVKTAIVIIGAVQALFTIFVLMIAWDAYCAELRLEARVGRLEERVHAVESLRPRCSMTRIPESGDLSAIEQAVWAVEYVRARAGLDEAHDDRVDLAIESANHAVDDLRHARELR